ncbi:hypothetical protein FNF31_07587 [Cafeteria roenbergensis]|uniref:Lipocalin/cytosolic fatty-acid binding domain-containing protein n=1 Tax=Cafeteria roenbergensis TaxID=33653 RepID=A0A5A8C313_CAFRO|nr:hypothetical protein FNF31_07587 [Cafeteria roenbergensis]
MHALGAATLPVGSGVLALVVLALASSQVLPGASADGCSHPPPAAGFNQSQYRGVWYEIAKIQTAGGAFFEKDCVCTQLNVRADAGGPASNLLVDNLCRKDTPAGELLNFTGTLQNATAPGQWQESFFAGIPGVNYTVIMSGTEGEDTYAVEYDCGDPLDISWLTNYCIHVLARKPTMSPDLLARLLEKAEAMGLNSQGLGVTHTRQAGCWSTKSLRGSAVVFGAPSPLGVEAGAETGQDRLDAAIRLAALRASLLQQAFRRERGGGKETSMPPQHAHTQLSAAGEAIVLSPMSDAAAEDLVAQCGSIADHLSRATGTVIAALEVDFVHGFSGLEPPPHASQPVVQPRWWNEWAGRVLRLGWEPRLHERGGPGHGR